MANLKQVLTSITTED